MSDNEHNPYGWRYWHGGGGFERWPDAVTFGCRPGTEIPGNQWKHIGPAWITDANGRARWLCMCRQCFWVDAYRGYHIVGQHFCAQCTTNVPYDPRTIMVPLSNQEAAVATFLLGGLVAVARMAEAEVQMGDAHVQAAEPETP